VWKEKNRERWKTFSLTPFYSTKFGFSTRVFHFAKFEQVTKRKKEQIFPKKGMHDLPYFVFPLFYQVFFHTRVRRKRRQKQATSPMCGAFPQFPQALLILLLTIYIILSL
jgi:hypothetical protein